MPLYEYECPRCGRKETAFRAVDDRHESPKCHEWMQLVISAAMVQPDIAPYRATVVDVANPNGPPPVIGGRKSHKEFLKRNRLVEVGDAKPADTSRMRDIHNLKSRRELREQMRPIVREALRRGSR